jgi:hypothetical protein
MKCLSFILLTCLLVFTAKSQSKDSAIVFTLKLPEKYFTSVEKRSSQLGKKIDAKTEKTLKQFSKQEQKLYRKLYKIDSVAAKELFSQSQQKINMLTDKLKNSLAVTSSNVTQYIPHLDSLKTSLNFLNQLNRMLSGSEKLNAALQKANILDSKFQSAEEIRNYLKQRKQQLKDVLSKFGFAKELKKLNKEVYYYQAQINEYKEIIKDPKKIEKKTLTELCKLPAFQRFMKENSMLSGLFRMPANYDSPQSLTGLQTKSDIQNVLLSKFSGTGATTEHYIQQQLSVAQGEMSKLRSRLNEIGAGSSNEEIPDFKPNTARTKSFLKRLEYSTNFQTTKSTKYSVAVTDIALGVGYKLSGNNVAGVMVSYKIGIGKSFNNIRLSNAGLAIRTYFDAKIKKSIYLTGGYEYNYRSSFKNIAQVSNYNLWQKSAMIGLSKIVDMRSKIFKKTKLMLLYDALWKTQQPVGQQLNFRIGHTF